MKKYREFISIIKENNTIDISLFPPDIKKTLDEYDYNQHGFDWNEEQDKHGKNLIEWTKNRENIEFSKNIDKLIKLTDQDLSSLRVKEYSDKKVKELEQQILNELSDEQVEEILYDGVINVAKVESFVERNPEYKNLFNEWENLMMKDINITIKDLNAFRSSTSYKRIEALNKFLKKLKTDPTIQRRLW